MSEPTKAQRQAMAKARARRRMAEQQSVMLRDENRKPGLLAGVINEATDSALMGFGAELDAATTALVGTAPGANYRARFAENFFDQFADREILQSNFRRENPTKSFLGQVGGGITAGLGSAKLASPLLNRVGPFTGITALGAAEGAAFGAGMAPPGERLSGAATGSIVGGVASPLVMAGGSATMRGLRPVFERLQNALFRSPDDRAKQLVMEAIENEDLTREEAVSLLRSMGRESVLADLGDNLARLGRVSTSEMGPLASRTKLFLDDRQAGQQMRLRQAARRATADSSFDKSLTALTNNAESKAKPLYDEAYSSLLEPTEALISLTERPAMQTAMKKSSQMFRNEFGQAPSDIFDMRFADLTKRNLDDMIGAARRKGNMNESRVLGNLKQEFVSELDAQVPVYAQAREVFSGEAAIREASDFGRQMFKGRSTTIPDAVEAIGAMGESELRAARVGFLDWLSDEMSNQSVNRNFAEKFRSVPKFREFVGLLFPDREAVDNFLKTAANESTFSQTRATVTAGSPTARIQADRSLLSQGIVGLAADAAVGPEGLLAALLRNIRGNTKVSPEVIERVGEILFDPNITSNSLRPNAALTPIPMVPRNAAMGAAAGFTGAQQPNIIAETFPAIAEMQKMGLLNDR